MKTLDVFKVQVQKLFSNVNPDKKIKTLTIIGLLGILLIFLSSGFSFNEKKDKDTKENSTYLKTLENRVLGVVKSIKGVGEVNVMVTLEGGVEYVFAQEQKQSEDKTEDFDGPNTKKRQQRDNSEEKYILVDGENGKREALIKTELEPKVKGVVIVCEGADDLVVQRRVLEAVTIALDISSTRVCITKLN
jgi:stage III sporulation protein AG